MEVDRKLNWSVLYELARNDMRARYSNSVLGILWAFVMPVVTILVFWFVFQLGFKNPAVGDVPYILWFAAAYIPWIFFTDTVSFGSNCLVEYNYLVKKIRFNVAIIPPVKLISALFVHLFFIGFLFLMKLCYQQPFTLHTLQVLYYTFALSIHMLGIIYLLSAFTVFFKDMNSLVNIVIQIGFWVTPIMWNEESLKNDLVRNFLTLNPIYYITSGYRDSLIHGVWFWEKGVETIYFWAVTLLLLIAGGSIFRKLRPYFADEV